VPTPGRAAAVAVGWSGEIEAQFVGAVDGLSRGDTACGSSKSRQSSHSCVMQIDRRLPSLRRAWRRL